MVGKFNVLVVDDDPDKAHLLEFALQMAGYDVRVASNGEEGLAVVESYQPDLVIADVMMPLVDGYELARRIRENPRTRFIPVILQTAGRSNAEDLRKGSEVGALGYITDPTDLDLLLARTRTLLDFKSYLDSCEEAAFTDHLTGLPNRRRFERQLDREVARTLRYGHAFSLLMLDIDHFKLVNDTHGHEAGDQTLSRLGRVLQEGTRGIDLASRIGGEEFSVILTETDLIGALEVAERLRLAIKALEVPGVGGITASFGVAEFPSDAQTARELITLADNALYMAKREGRDRIVGVPRQSNSKMAGSVQS
ncbi:MAG: diguanylate cyclase response regulator [Acidobacteria bacterium]|nr:MAG: diguanylate cyclase response regulator [Acidobacteriota bacterium]